MRYASSFGSTMLNKEKRQKIVLITSNFKCLCNFCREEDVEKITLQPETDELIGSMMTVVEFHSEASEIH